MIGVSNAPPNYGEKIMQNSSSVVYIIELSQSIGGEHHTASTYIGFADDGDWARRLQEHRSGAGSRMLAYCASVGIEFNVVAVFSGDRRLERGLKNRKNARAIIAQLRAGRALAPVTYNDRKHGAQIINVPVPMFVN